MTYCPLSDIDYIITDRNPAPEFRQIIEENGHHIVLCDSE